MTKVRGSQLIAALGSSAIFSLILLLAIQQLQVVIKLYAKALISFKGQRAKLISHHYLCIDTNNACSVIEQQDATLSLFGPSGTINYQLRKFDAEQAGIAGLSLYRQAQSLTQYLAIASGIEHISLEQNAGKVRYQLSFSDNSNISFQCALQACS